MNLLALIYWLSLQSLAISVPAFGSEEGKDGVPSEISLDNEPAYYYSDNLLPPKALAFANKKVSKSFFLFLFNCSYYDRLLYLI